MNIILGVPPMFDQIVRAFPEAKDHGVIFSWGNAIYNPDGVLLPAELLAHEAVHRSRQGLTEAGIRRWWEFYIKSPEFRLEEEIPAHRAEYRKFCQRNKNRELRPQFLDQVVERLSGPLYGNLISARDARKAIVQ